MNSLNVQSWPGQSEELEKEMKFFHLSDIMTEIAPLNKAKETCVPRLYTLRVLCLLPL